MGSSFRRRLLGTTLPVTPEPVIANAVSTTAIRPVPTLADVEAAVKALGPRPRWAGGGMPGIAIEVAADLPPGWFSLREPSDSLPYAGPLPLSSFGIFYRGGDVVRLSPRDHAALLARAVSSDPPPVGRGG